MKFLYEIFLKRYYFIFVEIKDVQTYILIGTYLTFFIRKIEYKSAHLVWIGVILIYNGYYVVKIKYIK